MKKHRIGIHGVPRSGTTWLGELINSSPIVQYKFQPLFSYELKGLLSESSNLNEINDFFNKLTVTKSSFLDQLERKKRGIIPEFDKQIITHIVYKEVRYHNIIKNLMKNDQKIKIVGIVRNPLATIDSWFRASREFRIDLGWSELEEWQFAKSKNLNKPEEFNGYNRWKEVAYLFHDLELKHQNRFLLINYDNLLKNTKNEVKRLFDFCNLRITEQTTEFMQKSRKFDKIDDYSVYNSKVNDERWKNSLNMHIVQAITEDIKNTSLEKYL